MYKYYLYREIIFIKVEKTNNKNELMLREGFVYKVLTYTIL